LSGIYIVDAGGRWGLKEPISTDSSGRSTLKSIDGSIDGVHPSPSSASAAAVASLVARPGYTAVQFQASPTARWTLDEILTWPIVPDQHRNDISIMYRFVLLSIASDHCKQSHAQRDHVSQSI